MSEINASNFKKEHGDLAPDLVGVTELTSPYFFVPPSGTTAERPEDCEPGTLRFNTDVGSLEVFRGKTIGWEQIQRRDGQYLGGGTGSNTGTGTRGVFGMRAEPSITDSIDFITISTLGNAQDFGNSTDARYTYSTCASSTRGFMGGGFSGLVDTIDFVTFASTGDATDFGNLTQSRWVMCQGAADSTRGMFVGGLNPSPSTTYNIIDYITMASAGDAQDFGDLNYEQKNGAAASNSTRGLFFGGNDGGNPYNNNISFITIATLGNAVDFGDATVSAGGGGASSSPTRAVRGGGLAPGNSNVIDFVEILTTGNAVDFGNLVASGHNLQGFSNGHGGL